MAYYNETDKFAAAWLRNLIDADLIAPGDVDERSIEDVTPADIAGYKQCHFFAGIGVWSFALRLIGWPDDQPIWTGSCPCQPFSAAGKGDGFADERHLWPAFHHLIAQCRPAIVFGEQVAGAVVLPWIDLVANDMEGAGYAFAAAEFPAAAVGAPHIRQRLYWFAHLPEVRNDEAYGSLLRGEARERWEALLMQGMRRTTQEEVSRVKNETTNAKSEIRCGIHTGLSSEASCEGTDTACKEAGKQDGTAIRSGSTRKRNSKTHRLRILRTDGTANADTERSPLEHPIVGSDQASGRVRLDEYEGGLPCSELRPGILGAGNLTDDRESNGSQEMNSEINPLQLQGEESENSWWTQSHIDKSIGAPHIRDRIYWMGHAIGARLEGYRWHGYDGHEPGRIATQSGRSITTSGTTGGMAECEFCGYEFDHELLGRYGCPNCEGDADIGGLGNTDSDGTGRDGRAIRCQVSGQNREHRRNDAGAPGADVFAGALHGAWRDADWLFCRDGKWRPVEPGTSALAVGTASRVGLLRAYGNAIVAPQAAAFIACAMDAIAGMPAPERVVAQPDLFAEM